MGSKESVVACRAEVEEKLRKRARMGIPIAPSYDVGKGSQCYLPSSHAFRRCVEKPAYRAKAQDTLAGSIDSIRVGEPSFSIVHRYR